MTPLKFEFELNCLQIHLINHYPVLPLSVSLEVRPSLPLPSTGSSSLIWAPHITFLSSSTACSQANREACSHAPSGDSKLTLQFCSVSFTHLYIICPKFTIMAHIH